MNGTIPEIKENQVWRRILEGEVYTFVVGKVIDECCIKGMLVYRAWGGDLHAMPTSYFRTVLAHEWTLL